MSRRPAIPFVARCVELLERTPAVLRAWLPGLSEEWVAAREGAGTFSARDVVGHLIHGEDTDWIPRLHRILDEGERLPFDPFDRFAHRRIVQGRPLSDLAEEFAAKRTASLAALRAVALRPADLRRRGRHPALGRVTARQLLATWVAHDLDHLQQIARVMARRHRDEVGPWRAYLRILTPVVAEKAKRRRASPRRAEAQR